VVYSPSWLSQFTTSVDYYSIDITDAIATLGNQEIVDRCVAGETAVCSLIVRNGAGTITQILAIPINVAQQKTKGLDVETSWRQELGSLGRLTFRALVSHINNLTTINGPVKTEAAGQNSAGVYNTPNWRWLGSVDYAIHDLSITATARGFDAGVYDNTYVSGINIDDNHIPGAAYVDLAGTYHFTYGSDNDVEAYFKIENVLDRDPAVVAGAAISALQTNPALYDVVGRNYRIGVRVKF
jgi:hypothetical protein